MDYYAVAGMVAAGFIAIFGFMASIKKSLSDEKRPIEELNLSVTKLDASINHMIENDTVRDKRLTKHGSQIDEIVERQRMNEKLLAEHELRIRNLEKESE